MSDASLAECVLAWWVYIIDEAAQASSYNLLFFQSFLYKAAGQPVKGLFVYFRFTAKWLRGLTFNIQQVSVKLTAYYVVNLYKNMSLKIICSNIFSPKLQIVHPYDS